MRFVIDVQSEEKKSADIKAMRNSMEELRSKIKKEMSQYETPPAVQRPDITPRHGMDLEKKNFCSGSTRRISILGLCVEGKCIHNARLISKRGILEQN